MDQSGSGRWCEKWLHSVYVTQVVLTGFADGLDTGYEKKRGVKDASKVLGLRNRRLELPFTYYKGVPIGLRISGAACSIRCSHLALETINTVLGWRPPPLQ